MKDAKGHGSDGRGGSAAAQPAAHASGVAQIGQESADSRELRLFADNNADLHRQSEVPVLNNLEKKSAKGIYDSTQATKLWGYHADRAAQAYAKEHGTPDQPWHQMFSPAVRREAAAHWERDNRK